MPNRRTHVAAGVTAGLVATLLTAQDEPGPDRIVEVLGGMIGGYLGGRAPDLLDPPLNPCHRGVAHGGLAVLTLLLAELEAWRQRCRSAAREYEARAAVLPPGSTQRGDLIFQALLHRFAAGFATGLKAGYASHLALDLCTPRGLPLVGR